MTNKPQMNLVDLNFIAWMADILEAGNNKQGRKPEDWKNKTPETARFEHHAKVMRHLRDYVNETDPDVKRDHAAALACNALILWWFA